MRTYNAETIKKIETFIDRFTDEHGYGNKKYHKSNIRRCETYRTILSVGRETDRTYRDIFQPWVMERIRHGRIKEKRSF